MYAPIRDTPLETSLEKMENIVRFGRAMARSKAEELRFPKHHRTLDKQFLVRNHNPLKPGH